LANGRRKPAGEASESASKPRPPTPTGRSPSPRSRRASKSPAVPAPVLPLDRLAQARREADAGTLDKALQSCKEHLSVTEPSADAYSLLGVIHQARKERAQAIDCFRKALYLDPKHGEALLHLLLLYQESGDEEAAKLLRQRLARKAAGGET